LLGPSRGTLDLLGLVCLDLHVLGWACWHAHLLFEIDFGEGVVLLPIFDFSVSFVNEVVTGCNMVMPIILDTLDSVFIVKLELFKQAVEKLLLKWHFLFTREESHISISVFNL